MPRWVYREAGVGARVGRSPMTDQEPRGSPVGLCEHLTAHKGQREKARGNNRPLQRHHHHWLSQIWMDESLQ